MNIRSLFRNFTFPVMAGLLVLGSLACQMLSGGNSGNTEPTTFEEAWPQERDRLTLKKTIAIQRLSMIIRPACRMHFNLEVNTQLPSTHALTG
jgi:hypothetical protein